MLREFKATVLVLMFLCGNALAVQPGSRPQPKGVDVSEARLVFGEPPETDVTQDWPAERPGFMHPGGYTKLPGKLEKNARTFWRTLQLFNNGNIKYMVVDACKSARYIDMGAAFGMFSPNNYDWEDQCYWGWNSDAMTSATNIFNNFMVNYWDKAARGSTIYECWDYARHITPGGLTPGSSFTPVGYGDIQLRSIP